MNRKSIPPSLQRESARELQIDIFLAWTLVKGGLHLMQGASIISQFKGKVV